MAAEGRYYFVADLHLGPDTDPEGARERAFVEYLHSLPADAKGLFLLGDIFDFWVDYHDVVPRGNVRLLAALAEVAERTDVWFFRGNHDWWVTDYFEKELGVHIVREPYRIFDLGGRRVLIGHGDTLGAHDAKAKLIFHVFRNRVCIALLTLMGDPERAAAIVTAMKKAVDIPVTVKFRSGIREDSRNCVEFAKRIAPVSTACWFDGCENLTEISGWENALTMKLEKMELGEPDEKGRRSVKGTGEYETVSVTSILTATGQKVDLGGIDLKPGGKGTVEADAVTCQTETPDVFAGGDAVTGPQFVIDAIAAGKEADDLFPIRRHKQGSAALAHKLRFKVRRRQRSVQRLTAGNAGVPQRDDAFYVARLKRTDIQNPSSSL